MSSKPTYEQLVQTVKKLEREIEILRQNEKSLRESEHKLNSHLQHTPIGAISWNMDFRVREWNPAAETIFGYSKEEAMDRHPSEIILTKEAIGLVDGIFHDLITEKGGVRSTNENKTKDGRRIICDWYNTTMKDSEGRVTGVASLVHDITDRLESEAELRARENEYRSTLNDLRVGVVVHDRHTRILFSNPEASNILGLTFKQMSGKGVIDPAWNFVYEDFSIVKVEDYPASKVFSSKKPIYDYVLGVIRPERDDVTWAIVNAVPVFSEKNELDKVVVNFVDITTRKKMEIEKTRLESQLRQATKMEAVGTLAGGIAHDFNNILGIIIGNSELAMDEISDWHPAQRNLNEIKTAGMRARDVIRQLLNFSRKTEQSKKPVNIGSIIKESVQLLRASIPTSIELSTSIPSNLNSVLADPTQIHQVIINLCTNAAHAMEDRGGRLEVSLTEIEINGDNALTFQQVCPGPYIQLTVRDTGCGIAPDIAHRIFDPYFSTKDATKGTGIGLAVVHGIVMNHDGAISVESEPDKGTTVNVIFPVIDEKPTLEKAASEALPQGSECILFVDDEIALVKMGKAMLERLGYQVEADSDPLNALGRFRSDPARFDLVITDMTMPQMTGDLFIKEILKIKPGQPIILCTGYSERITRESANAMGVWKYIEKPLSKRDLSFAVRDVLDKVEE